MARKTAIPVGTQFSPDLFDLELFLKSLVAHSGNHKAIKAAFWTPPIHQRRKGVPSSKRTAELPLEAAMAYDLLEPKTYKATDLAQRLSQAQGKHVYEAFARHILLNLGGLRVVNAVQEMEAEGLRITGDSLATYLTDQGFPVTTHNTAINTMRMWLARAGVFGGKGWQVDTTVKERLLGLADADIEILASLNEDQRAFLDALCRMDPSGWSKAADVRALAEATSGRRLGRQSLPKQFLDPLKEAGLIEYESGGTAGGKSARLRVTPKFRKDVLQPFVQKTLKTLDAALISYFKRKPEDIYADLASKDTFVKGQALEAYAIYVMRLLGLRFVAWRKRAKDTTGRAEVDALLSGLFGGLPTRWQVQCKNTPSSRLDLENVAKEVGLLPLTHATHILVLANCEITRDAQDYAAMINRRTQATVFLLGGGEFEAVKSSPGSLGAILRQKAENILRQQPKDLWLPD